MEESTKNEGLELELEYPTRSENVACIVSIMQLMDMFTTLTKTDVQRAQRIRRKCLRLCDSIISEIHDEYFDSDEDE